MKDAVGKEQHKATADLNVAHAAHIVWQMFEVPPS